MVLHQIEENKVTFKWKSCSFSSWQVFFTTLRYYASGNFQINVGNHCGIHQSRPTVSKVIHEVSRAIAGLSQRYIKIPSTREEMNTVIHGFYQKARFPMCKILDQLTL